MTDIERGLGDQNPELPQDLVFQNWPNRRVATLALRLSGVGGGRHATMPKTVFAESTRQPS